VADRARRGRDAEPQPVEPWIKTIPGAPGRSERTNVARSPGGNGRPPSAFSCRLRLRYILWRIGW
jgi:hypothetical protein